MNGYPFDSAQFCRDSGTPLVRIRDILRRTTEVRWVGDYVSEAEVEDGDVLIGMDGEFNVGWWQGGKALLNQRVCCLRAMTRLHQRYLYYFIPAPLQAINDVTYSTTVKHLSSFDVLRIRFALPPTDEQRAIAAFLDRETARIDELIAKKQQLIELLAEKRTALISHAVTKGLNRNAPMKDSGIDWLGSVPKHWEFLQLKHTLLAKPGAVKTGPFGSQLLSSEMAGGSIKVYNQRTVLDRDFEAGDNYISEGKYAQLKGFTTFPGDILVTTRGTIGRCAVVPKDSPLGILHPCVMRIQVNDQVILRDYLALLIQESGFVTTQLRILSNATTIEVVYSDSLKQVYLPVPTIGEQFSILKAMSEEMQRLQYLHARIGTAIERLHEYRSALISAAVTGKIDVRSPVV